MKRPLLLCVVVLLFLMASCQPVTTSPQPVVSPFAVTAQSADSVPSFVTPTSASKPIATTNAIPTPIAEPSTAISNNASGQPCSIRMPDVETRFATLSKEWPVPTWLPTRLKLCSIYQEQDESGEVVSLVYEGEGRNYNGVKLSLRQHPPPRHPAIEIDEGIVKLGNGIEAHQFYVRYGGTLLSWPLGKYWIQLDYMGDALNPEETIKVAEGVIPPQ